MTNKQVIKKLLKILVEYNKIIYLIIWCLLLSSVLNLCIPIISRDIMDKGFIEGDKQLLLALIFICFILYLINFLLDMIKEKQRIDITAKIQYKLSEESYQHLIKLKIQHFDQTNYAELLNNLQIDIGNMTAITDNSLFFVITQIFSIFGGIIGLFIIDFRLTMLVLFFIPIKYFIMKYFAKKRKKIMDGYIETSRKYARWFGDCLGGIKEIRLFVIYDNKKREFEQKQQEVIKKQKQLNWISQENIITDSVLMQLLIMVLYIAGANLVFDMQLSIGSIFTFITYSTYVTAPISAILNIGYLLSGIIPSAKRYYKFMELKEETDKGIISKEVLGNIEFKNVSFSYIKGKEVLKNIELIIPYQNKVAIIGMNGSGKTTIIELLLRLYEAQSGEIILDNHNIQDYNLEIYRQSIAVVNQQIYLFNDIIRNNICLYKNISNEILEKVIEESGLNDFVRQVSLDYLVGENGAMLSGG